MKQDMRVQMTRRMLKEGLLRSLSRKPLSMITVSDLCKESGVNRATFYNHYDTPVTLLRDIANDYAEVLRAIYFEEKTKEGGNDEKAVLACLEYLYDRKKEVKLLCSKNAENSMSGFGLDIVQDGLIKRSASTDDPQAALLEAVIVASAAYGLFKVWLINDIKKTPKEILAILKNMTEGSFEQRFKHLKWLNEKNS